MTEKKSGHNINDLRSRLFEALDGVKSGNLDLDKARAINEIGKTIIDTAKVEVDFIRATEGNESLFISGPLEKDDPVQQQEKNPVVGASSIFRHRLAG
jgi:hypothetical protein